MLTLLQWLFAHLLGDFVFQTRAMVRNKKRLKAKSPALYFHCLLHGLLTYTITLNWSLWPAAIIIAVTHYLIDLWKLYRPDKLLYFVLDQAMHLLVIVTVWALYFVPLKEWLPAIHSLSENRFFWITVTGYLLVTFPLSILLGYATQRWRLEAESGEPRSALSLSEAGKWIGIFERLLVYTFVLTNHFEGIGFLIAAKSILRFNDIKGSSARKEAEYILIGTLMSFSASIIIALIVRRVTFCFP